jgi:hypothetical protein
MRTFHEIDYELSDKQNPQRVGRPVIRHDNHGLRIQVRGYTKVALEILEDAFMGWMHFWGPGLGGILMAAPFAILIAYLLLLLLVHFGF